MVETSKAKNEVLRFVGVIKDNKCQVAIRSVGESHPLYPMDVCNAFTQGYIGYHLQNSLNEALINARLDKKATTIITQVEVAKDDPAFKKPTKPIGRFYTREEAMNLMAVEKFPMLEDSGRGWRRVVPSPKPLEFVLT